MRPASDSSSLLETEKAPTGSGRAPGGGGRGRGGQVPGRGWAEGRSRSRHPPRGSLASGPRPRTEPGKCHPSDPGRNRQSPASLRPGSLRLRFRPAHGGGGAGAEAAGAEREGRAHKGAGGGARRGRGGQSGLRGWCAGGRAGGGSLGLVGWRGCRRRWGRSRAFGRAGPRPPRQGRRPRRERAGGQRHRPSPPHSPPRPAPGPLGAWLTSTGPGGPRCTSVPCGGRLCPRSGQKLPRPGRQPRPQPSHAAPPAWAWPGTSARGRGAPPPRRPANRWPAPQRRSQ